jgi:hypothetical protein
LDFFSVRFTSSLAQGITSGAVFSRAVSSIAEGEAGFVEGNQKTHLMNFLKKKGR